MTFSPPRIATIAVLAVCMLLGAGNTPAGAAVPAEIEDRIRTAADMWRANARQQAEMERFSGDPHMSAVARSLNRQVSASLISQAVMESISRDPSTATEATTLALTAAPELRSEIQTNLAVAFPTMPRLQAVPERRPPVETAPRRSDTQPASAQPRGPPATADVDEADAAAAELLGPDTDNRDPLEDVNRAIFAFNDFLDSYIMVPIAKTYRFIMPETLREMGRNFFENFNEPVVAINDALQGDFENAGTSLGRFVVNSTVGLFGFFEVAERIDLKEHPADFGQTLHTYGVGSGPYVMLPFFGPSTVRDAVGKGVDSFLNPISYLLDFETRLYLKASEIVVDREDVLDELEELRKGSLDYYAAVRSAWFQNRAQELRKGEPPPADDIDKLFADVK